jgi:hypothetical protein
MHCKRVMAEAESGTGWGGFIGDLESRGELRDEPGK